MQKSVRSNMQYSPWEDHGSQTFSSGPPFVSLGNVHARCCITMHNAQNRYFILIASMTSTRALHVRYYVLVVGFHLFPLCSRHSACFLSLILSSFTSTASDGPSAFIRPEFVSGYPAHQHVQHYLLLQQDWCRVNSSICSCHIQGFHTSLSPQRLCILLQAPDIVVPMVSTHHK